MIENAIIRLRLLEGVWGLPETVGSAGRAVHGFVLILEYLAHHAWIETNPASLLGRIRHTAVTLSQKLGDSSTDAVFQRIKILWRLSLGNELWLGYHQTVLGYDPVNTRGRPRATEISPTAQQADLCVAAIYLGYHSYVQGLIAKGYQFCTWGGVRDIESGAFGPAFEAAASKGDVAMLRLLLSSNPNYGLPEPPPSSMRRKILKAAAINGHKEAFNFALDLGPFNLTDGELQDSRRFPEYQCLKSAISSTPHLENYQRGSAMFTANSKVFKPRNRGDPYSRLIRKSAAGHLEMVRYFLDKSVPPNMGHDPQGSPRTSLPLVAASVGGRAEVVRLLLERGADPNYSPVHHTALMAAAQFGFFSIVKILLQAGARVDDGLPAPIVLAVFREDMDLFRMLRRHGARLDTPETGGWAMAIAQFHRLESMVNMLVQEGVEADFILRRCAGRYERAYAEYLFPNRLFGSPDS